MTVARVPQDVASRSPQSNQRLALVTGDPRRPRRGVNLVRASTAAEWSSSLEGRAGVTPFHHWSWLQGQAQLQGWRFEPLLVRRGTETLGCLPLLLRRRGPLWVSAPAPFLYVGPLASAEDLPDVLGALRRWSRRNQVLVTRLDFAPDVAGSVTAALVAAGCDVDERTTFLLDLSGGVDGVHTNLHSSLRKSLRTAQRSGVVVRASTEQEVVTLLPALLAEAFSARGLPSPYPPETGRWAWDELCARRSLSMTAVLDGQPAGLLTGIGEGAVLYGWAGGSFRAFRNRRVSHALYVGLFEAAVAEGYDRVDMLGAVDEGTSQFKASFGAKPATFVLAQQTTYRSYAYVRQQWQSRRTGTEPS